MKQITVIVPIYNVEKYLKKCIVSLIKQTFKDFDVLLVNDGSPANEQVIIDEYVSKYPNLFKCIKKENGGYGSVLELAINSIGTPYFLVCDPDDTLTDNALEILYKLISDNDCDIAIGCKNYVYDNSDEATYHQVYNKDYVTFKDIEVADKESKEIEKFYFLDPSPHAKLYKTKNAKGCLFPKKIGYTDNLLYYYNLSKANRVVYTSKALSNYLIDRPGNSMSLVNEKFITSQIEVFNSILKQATNNPMLDYRMFESFMWLFYEIKRVDCSKEKKLELALSLTNSFKELSKYSRDVLNKYKEYSKAHFMERIRDKKIIRNENNAYINYARKIYG